MEIENLLPALSSHNANFHINKASKYFTRQSQRCSMLFLLSYSYTQITRSRLKVLSPYENSFYCVDSQNQIISDDIIHKVSDMINDILVSKDKIEQFSVPKSKLIQYFKNQHMMDKILILNHINSISVDVVRFRDMIDLSYGAYFVSNNSSFGQFELSSPYKNGFFLLFPQSLPNQSLIMDIPKDVDSIDKYTQWSNKNCFDNVHSINQHLISDLSNINIINTKCKEFDSERLNSIANLLVAEYPKKRLISVAGISSSGKSTFSIHLKRFIEEHFDKRYECQIIQMDSYFLNRDERPLDENGKIDFESINIINIDLLAQRIDSLLNGDSIPARLYNYVNGTGSDLKDQTISLNQKGFVIVEGLHAINPAFISKIKNTEILKVYISPVAPLNIDDDHLINPNDILLLRRIIRDFNQRGSLPRTNISRWSNVIISASKYIIPFISSVDVYYINQLAFELNAMAPVVIPLLEKYSQPLSEEDNSDEITHELVRLKFLLSLFVQIQPEQLPENLEIKSLFINTLKRIK